MTGIFIGLWSATAVAQALYSGRISLTGAYYRERDQGSPGIGGPLSSTAQILYGDARLFLDARHLWDRLDLHLDARVRVTGNYDYEGQFTNPNFFTADPYGGALGAQGYLGGREYDLREVYLRLRLGDRVALQLGRMFVTEADYIKVDGARMTVKLGTHWEGGAFAGGYPNPYSSTLLTDYTPPCGDGVASGPADTMISNPLVPGTMLSRGGAGNPCQSLGPQLSLAGGLTGRYQYSGLVGNFGLVGSYFGGNDDGGPVQAIVLPQGVSTAMATAQANSQGVGNVQNANPQLNPPRIYVSWLNSLQLHPRLDLVSDLVVDLYGSLGPQPTRIFVQGTARLGEHDRVVLRLSYTHLSPLAIDMFLGQLLYNRAPNGSTLAPNSLGVVENNLTVLTTAQDEARGSLDVRLWPRGMLVLDGRFRYRSLVNGESNSPVYVQPPNPSQCYTCNTMDLAGDGTVGLRDRGTLLGLRLGASYTFLSDFRAQSHVVRASLGRDFLRQRLGIDLSYLLVDVRDAGAGQSNTMCTPARAPVLGMTTTVNPFTPGCFGQRTGFTHEGGVTLLANPTDKLFFLLDYRFDALLTDPQNGQAVPSVFSHSLLVRSEYRL